MSDPKVSLFSRIEAFSRQCCCLQRGRGKTSPPQPLLPAVLQSDDLLRSILAFLPFEEQTSNLRLVSWKFKMTCQDLLEEKLFDIIVVGYGKRKKNDEKFGEWFEVDVRRGWSNDSCTSKESCIDDALWVASCRCGPFDEECAFNNRGDSRCREHCLSDRQTSNRTNWDMDQARQLLRTNNGLVTVANGMPEGQGNQDLNGEKVSCAVIFEDPVTSSMQWSYLPILMEIISLYTEGRLQVADVPFSIRRSYGLEGSISSPRFLRSVFVAMLRSSTPPVHETVQTPQGFTGTSCVAVAQSVVKTCIVGENPCYFERLQVFLRFHSIHGTKIEMSFSRKFNLSE